MIDPDQLSILRHALGIGDCGTKPPFRNHFVTGEGSDDHAHCMALVERGLMARRNGSALSGGDDVFSVTADGRLAAAGTWVKQPRSKQRYANYLNSGSSLDFGNWLRSFSLGRCDAALSNAEPHLDCGQFAKEIDRSNEMGQIAIEKVHATHADRDVEDPPAVT